MLLNSALKNYTYITLLGFIGLLTYVFINVPNIPTADEWDLSYFVERFYENKLTISDLMIPHNECRMPYPHIINLCILFITRWHSFSLISFNLILLLIFYFTLREYVYKAINPQKIHIFSIGFILIFMVIYSLKQYENIVLSFDLNYYLSVIAAFGALISLRMITWKNIIISMVWAHIATYSYASGITVWPILICLIWLLSNDSLQNKFLYTLTVLAVFALNLVLYFNDYHPASSTVINKSTNPVELVPYALAFLSNNFSTSSSTAIKLTIIQLISIGLSVFVLLKYDKVKFYKTLPIFAYGLWALFVGIMVAHGRASLGITQALSPRYCTLSFPFTIVFIVSLIINIEYISSLTKIFFFQKLSPILLYLIVAFFSFHQVKFIEMANQRNQKLEKALAYIKASNFEAPEVKEMLYPDAAQLKQKVGVMKKFNLSIYR